MNMGKFTVLDFAVDDSGKQIVRVKFIPLIGESLLPTTMTLAQGDSLTIDAPIAPRDEDNPPPPRYWGIWCAPPDSKPGWMRDGNNRFYYYPSPAITQAAADDVGWSHTSVREFTVADVLGDGP